MKNKRLDMQGLQAAIELAQQMADQAQAVTRDSKTFTWTPVLAGLVNERNVLFVGLAAILMLWATMLSGWRISFVVVPIALALVLIPNMIW